MSADTLNDITFWYDPISPYAYLAFEGEQHGFRKVGTIIRCLEAELYFYGAVFGFTPADSIVPVVIDNVF